MSNPPIPHPHNPPSAPRPHLLALASPPVFATPPRPQLPRVPLQYPPRRVSRSLVHRGGRFLHRAENFVRLHPARLTPTPSSIWADTPRRRQIKLPPIRRERGGLSGVGPTLPLPPAEGFPKAKRYYFREALLFPGCDEKQPPMLDTGRADC